MQSADEVARLKAEFRLRRNEEMRSDARLAMAEIEQAKLAERAKTDRLRLLRLAKEAADREAAASRVVAPSKQKKRRAKAAESKPRQRTTA